MTTYRTIVEADLPSGVATDAEVAAAIAAHNSNPSAHPGLSGGGGLTPVAPIQISSGNISIAAATTLAAGSMSAAAVAKLNGIASGATANATDAQLRDRSTHTGTQPYTTITGVGGFGVALHYEQSFTESNLSIAKKLVVTHNLGVNPASIRILTPTGDRVYPGGESDTSASIAVVDMSDFSPLSGTWKIVING